MQRILSTLLLAIFMAGFSFKAEAQQAQVDPDQPYTLGAGLMYGSEIEQLGLRAEGFYTLNEDFRVGAALGYFFPDNFSQGRFNWFDLDLNINYFAVNENDLSIYGLAGLNLAFLSINYDDLPNYSETELGLNLGAGLEYNVEFASLFGEVKLGGIAGDADQLVVGAGLRFGL